ncbi:MAG: hypothetical protein IJ923_01640, partial [Campylobacter sp.]|nr:hypothetical protein [Campylobacter sp.]
MAILIYLMLTSKYIVVFITLFICFYIGILIVKILVFYKINGNLEGFTPFLNIVIDMPKTTGSQSGLNKSLNAEYYMIYMADMDKYLE